MTRRWTDEERQRLAWLWEVRSLRTLAKRLDRSRAGVAAEAKAIGLRLGRPNGYESVAAAARRCGVSERTLRRIMAWAGITPRLAHRSPALPARRQRVHLALDPSAIDRAMSAWCASETVEGAARARGVSGHGLRRLAREVLGDGRIYRISSQMADSLAAAWRAGVGPRMGPRRVGVRL